jgi:fumarate hydratase subunit beta
MKKISSPLDKDQIRKLKAGDKVYFSGLLYTARDQAHKRMVEAIKNSKRLPVVLKNQAIYYCGPTKKPKGKIIGSCGPTTSARMDEFTNDLLSVGLRAMVGKGSRSQEVSSAIKKYKAVYFITYAGCGALLSKCVKSAYPICYKDLGPEAIYKLEVKDFPLIVAIDTRGRNIYRLNLK